MANYHEIEKDFNERVNAIINSRNIFGVPRINQQQIADEINKIRFDEATAIRHEYLIKLSNYTG